MSEDASACAHEPDWSSLSMTKDYEAAYLDVCCVHCGRSGCLAMVVYKDMEIAW